METHVFKLIWHSLLLDVTASHIRCYLLGILTLNLLQPVQLRGLLRSLLNLGLYKTLMKLNVVAQIWENETGEPCSSMVSSRPGWAAR